MPAMSMDLILVLVLGLLVLVLALQAPRAFKDLTDSSPETLPGPQADGSASEGDEAVDPTTSPRSR